MSESLYSMTPKSVKRFSEKVMLKHKMNLELDPASLDQALGTKPHPPQHVSRLINWCRSAATRCTATSASST